MHKLDAVLAERAQAPSGTSRVIIQTRDGTAADTLIGDCHGMLGRRIASISARVAEVPDDCLSQLASHPNVIAVSADRQVRGALQGTIRATVGAAWVAEHLGFDGTGIGVAIVDSGVAAWHDDLGNNRVVHFADFVNRQAVPYDDYGHGTHVAGIIAGNGQNAGGSRRGIAPGAHLVVLKALEQRRRRQRQPCHRRDRLRGAKPGGLQHPHHQPVGLCRRLRVVHTPIRSPGPRAERSTRASS